MFTDGAFESRLLGRITATKFGMIRSLGARRRLFKNLFRKLAPLTCIAPHFLRRRAALLRFPDMLFLS
jgi:hypothetical protein